MTAPKYWRKVEEEKDPVWKKVSDQLFIDKFL